jgi:signal transduction histidine kinase
MSQVNSETIQNLASASFFLEQKKEHILSLWESSLRELIPAIQPMDSAVIRNSLPKLIDELTEALKDPKNWIDPIQATIDLGKEHGEERARLRDYDLNKVIEEYQLLKKIIFSTLRECTRLSEDEQDVIMDAITVGIRNSTSEFVKLKQNETLELIKKEAQAREIANKVISAFLINMSHEIRTPMTAILGYIELLRDPSLNSLDKKDAMERIERSSRALLSLLDDILDLAKIDSDTSVKKSEKFSPREIAQEVTELMGLSAKLKGIELNLEMDSTAPTFAVSDPLRIRQILLNLIGNAIKFTKKGRVAVKVKMDSANRLCFDVHDTGIGITTEDQLKLFKAFSQVDESMTRQFGGTGLGLLLSLRLAENLGGSLKLIESTPGKGSWFSFQVDASPYTFEKPPEALNLASPSIHKENFQAQSLLNKDILVVDDSIDNQMLIARFLKGAGARVELADDGGEAIENSLT